MRYLKLLPFVIVASMSIALPVGAGVVLQTGNTAWHSEYGIGGGAGLYFGFTSNPDFADIRELISYAPKFPNVTIHGGSPGFLASFSGIPSELSPGIVFDETTVATANVPVGTTLTFHEGDLNSKYTYWTLYHDVNGVPTPFQEFRP